MTLRRMLVSLGILIVLTGAGVGLFVLSGDSAPRVAVQATDEPEFLSFSFSYRSESELNPVLPGTKASQDQALRIDCEAEGHIHLGRSVPSSSALLFEFTFVRCGDADVILERGLQRTAKYTSEFLASEHAMQRATEDPLLAVARSLFLHMNLGRQGTWPATQSLSELTEHRLEGTVLPRVDWRREHNQIHWTKTFKGLPKTRETKGLTHSLEIQVSARSEVRSPIETGLLLLEGHEHSVSQQGQRRLARTDMTLHIQRETLANPADLQSLWAGTEVNRPALSPRLMTAAEKEALFQRWRSFRDHEGQKPARDATQENQDTYLELKQALRRDPSLAEGLKDDLNDIDPSSSAFATLAGALIYSGTENGLNAFVQIAREHKNDSDWQTRAVPMLGLAPVPTQESWAYLDEMRKSANSSAVKSAAELGMATHMKRGYQDARFVSEIEARMSSGASDAERLHLLDLVGNAGLEQVFPIVSSWFPGASHPLRLRILQSLRFMPGPDAESFLLREASNNSLDIALTALQSLQERTLSQSAIAPLLYLLENRSDDRLRLQALECLYAARHQDPQLLGKVRSIREASSLSPALSEAWKQVETDWVDPVET